MNHKNQINRGVLLMAYLSVIALMLSCAFITGVPQSTEDGTIRLENGSVEVQNTNGDWTPVAGESTFELVGTLENTDPWTVAGTTLETNDATQIDDGLQVNDLVHVKGTVLDDGTWLAYSIQKADPQTDSTITLIGVVTSTDPWVVNGITLNVTDTTNIQGDITTGMIVRVEILLQPDGTWEVLSIAPLGESTGTSGCATVIATVLSVNGSEIQFEGWPTTITLETRNNQSTDNTQVNDNSQNNEDKQENSTNDNENNNNGNDSQTGNTNIIAGDVVIVVVCNSNGSIVIVQITILNANVEADTGGASTGGDKVLVCHKPDKKGGHTLSIAPAAVPAHLGHGDTLGPCK